MTDRRSVFVCIAVFGLLLLSIIIPPQQEEADEVSLAVTTNKDCYAVGETVTIILTNTGDESIAFFGVPPSWPNYLVWDDQMNPYYTISDANGSWVRMEPVVIISATVVVDDFLLEPGESVEFEWNQTYLIYDLGEDGDEFNVLPPSWEQGPEGMYTIWAGGETRVGDEVHLIGDSTEFKVGVCEGPETIKVLTDKYCYEIGEDVTITVEGRVWVPAVGSFPELFYAITSEENESVVKPLNPFDMTYYFEGPETAVWNQTYLIYGLGQTLVPPSGEQVPPGLYYIWFYEVLFSEWYGIEPAEILIGACGGPVADAGPSQTIFEGETATFDGSFSVGSYGDLTFSGNVKVNEYHPQSELAKGDPQIQVNDDGVIHVVWVEFFETIFDAVLYYSKSADGGSSFESNIQIVNATKTEGSSISLNPRFTVDKNGTIYVIWTDWRNGDNHPEIYYTRSSDGGTSFDEPHPILSDNVSCGLSIDSRGNLHLLGHGISRNLHHLVSENGGVYFEKPVRVNDDDVMDTSNLGRDLSMMVVDSFDNIHVAWPGKRIGEDSHFAPDVLYSKSEDGGLSFSKNLKVHGETGRMFEGFGGLDVDSLGNPHVVWLESNFNELSERIMYAKSDDGGESFGERILVKRGDDITGMGMGFVTAPSIAVGPDDVPRITWVEHFKSVKDCNVWFSEFDESRNSFSPRLLVSDHGRNDTMQAWPSIDIDDDGFSHIAWSDKREGEYEIFYARTVLGRVAIVSYQWDMDDFSDSDGDGNFTNDVDAIGSTPTYAYGDDGVYNVTLKITDEMGATAYDTTTVTVVNVVPSISNISYEMRDVNASILFRIAGEKWHNVEVHLFEDDVEIGYANITRYPGSPNDQMVSLADFSTDFSNTYSAIAYYTPEDDPINGQIWGATPAWFILKFDNEERKIHHTFNVRHEETWVWNVEDMNQYFPFVATFEAIAYDPGSDDLLFLWNFGDGSVESHIYYNDGMNPDLYPSSEGIFPMTVTDTVQHVYWEKVTYQLTLTVFDDDSGEAFYTLEIVV